MITLKTLDLLFLPLRLEERELNGRVKITAQNAPIPQLGSFKFDFSKPLRFGDDKKRLPTVHGLK